MSYLSADMEAGSLSTVDSRTSLAQRRASFVRMDAVSNKTKDKGKLSPPCSHEDDDIDEEDCLIGGRRRRPTLQRAEQVALPDHMVFRQHKKHGSLKKKANLNIPMPFFSPQVNFQKAFKMFPDLTVSCALKSGTSSLVFTFHLLDSISWAAFFIEQCLVTFFKEYQMTFTRQEPRLLL